MDYRIAIPSYKRSKTINDKTIAYLKRTDINLDLVDVFISDENEYELYKNNIDVNIIKGAIGCGGNRNFITRYYKENQKILFMDDDIKTVSKYINKKKLLEIKDLDLMIKENFQISLSKNNNLWGIYPVHNAFFMKTKISFGLKYVIGCFYGVVNNHKKHAFVELEDKEDFERTIKYFLNDNGVTRFNYIAPSTVYYKEAGGMQETRTKERVKSSALILAKKYPKLCKVFISKKGYYEIRFKNIKKVNPLV
tara:strand:- start:396 stop:1148 length:753 start_codon:yes stop_codon:yes gene_type:complete